MTVELALAVLVVQKQRLPWSSYSFMVKFVWLLTTNCVGGLKFKGPT
jgi:hypothetical protein